MRCDKSPGILLKGHCIAGVNVPRQHPAFQLLPDLPVGGVIVAVVKLQRVLFQVVELMIAEATLDQLVGRPTVSG